MVLKLDCGESLPGVTTGKRLGDSENEARL
jgi:hypothetical protein